MKTIELDNRFLREALCDINDVTNLMVAWNLVSQNGTESNTLTDRILSSICIEIAEAVLLQLEAEQFYDENQDEEPNFGKLKCLLRLNFKRTDIFERGIDK